MNESEFPKVSVIIPVYNVWNYLRKCLDSVINQSLREIEIILIDDGSTDGSGKICDEYAAQDNRIQVIHEPNEGLSCARNNGISISTAPFIMFVDADDWVGERFCELPYKAAMNHHSDMVLFAHNTVDQDGNIKQPQIGMLEGPLSEAEAMCYNVTISNAAWLALYSRRLFDGNSFPENRYYEDVGVIHQLIHKSTEFYFLDIPLYNHRIGRPGSITTDSDIKKLQDYRDMYKVRIKDLLDWGYDSYARKLAFSMLIKYGAQEEFFANIVRQTNSRIHVGCKQRIMLFVLRLSPNIFDLICSITGKRVRVL